MPSTSRPQIKLRRNRWQEICIARGLHTDTARAAAIGVHRSQLHRIQTGESAPGESFMAAACARLDCRLDDLFEVAS